MPPMTKTCLALFRLYALFGILSLEEIENLWKVVKPSHLLWNILKRCMKCFANVFQEFVKFNYALTPVMECSVRNGAWSASRMFSRPKNDTLTSSFLYVLVSSWYHWLILFSLFIILLISYHIIVYDFSNSKLIKSLIYSPQSQSIILFLTYSSVRWLPIMWYNCSSYSIISSSFTNIFVTYLTQELKMTSHTSSTIPNYELDLCRPAIHIELRISEPISRMKKTLLGLKDEILILLQAWTRAFEVTLCNQMSKRKKLQKIEFLINWSFILLLAAGAMYHGNFFIKNVSSYLHTIALLYIEMSLFTRLLAYIIDFANAREKLGKVPIWLALHHTGVVVIHITTALYFSRTYSKAMLYLLAIQSTHNTWTKKYSLVLYWGNVMLGVITSIYFSAMNITQDEVSLSMAPCLCMSIALFSTFVGISLLAIDCR